MDLIKSISVAASGLKAQAGRMRIISENIANADSTAQRPGADPYRRKVVSFQNRLDRELDATTVSMARVRRDTTPFKTKVEPGHPGADAQGNVKLPNVDPLVEMMDMREAQRSYEANLNLITATRRMISRTLDMLRV